MNRAQRNRWKRSWEAAFTRLIGDERIEYAVQEAMKVKITPEMVTEVYSRINFVDHDDSGILDGLRAVFEAAGFEVVDELQSHDHDDRRRCPVSGCPWSVCAHLISGDHDCLDPTEEATCYFGQDR